MAVLAFDTSSTACTVALCERDHLLAEQTVNVSRTHSEALVPMIEMVLKQAARKLDTIRAVAVVIGPGSFTGLRIGLSTAKGLALSRGLPLITLTSLEVLAQGVVGTPWPVCAMLSAQRGQVYGGIFQSEDGCMRLVGDYFVGEVGEISSPLLGDGPLVAVGEGALMFEASLLKHFGHRLIIPPFTHHVPRASHMARLAFEKLDEGKQADISSAVPFYLRLAAAEQQRILKEKGDH